MVAGALFLAYGVFGFAGFGAGIVGLPLIVHVLPLRQAIPVVLLLDLSFSLLLGSRNWRSVDKRELLRLVPFLAIGMAIGVGALSRAPEAALVGVLGGFVVANALWSLFGRSRATPVSTGWAAPAGTVGGTFSAMFGTGGPIYTLYLARRIAEPARLRACVAALIFGTALTRATLLAGSGLFAPAGLFGLAAMLLPCAGLGFVVGSRLHKVVSPARFRQAIWSLLLVSGGSLLWRAIA